MSTVTKIKDNFIYLIKNFPDDWEISKNKYAFLKIRNGKNMSDTTDVLSLTINGIKIKEDLTFGKTSNSYIGHQLVNVGDLVFTPRDFDQTPILSDVSKYDGCISNLYIVDRPNNEFLPEYINYFWHGLKYSFDYFKNFSYGIRFSFNREQFDEIPILKPSLNEQKIICTYLDDKLKHIDSLVKKIHRKINLLKEQKTSLINQCVTKGLNPNVEMKESGVEWIGKIPKHWEIIPVKRLFSTYFGGSWGEEPKENQINNLVSVIRVTEFDMNTLTVSKEIPTIRSLELPNNSQKLIKNGDLILEKSGGGEKTPVGRAVVFDQNTKGQVVNSNFTNVCRPNKNIVDPYFCVFVLSSLYSSGTTFRNIKQTTGIQNLDIDSFMSEKIVIPPMDEQLEISKKLKKSNNLIQDLVNKNNHKINLLKEYRRSVVSEAVTGKVKVTK